MFVDCKTGGPAPAVPFALPAFHQRSPNSLPPEVLTLRRNPCRNATLWSAMHLHPAHPHPTLDPDAPRRPPSIAPQPCVPATHACASSPSADTPPSDVALTLPCRPGSPSRRPAHRALPSSPRRPLQSAKDLWSLWKGGVHSGQERTGRPTEERQGGSGGATDRRVGANGERPTRSCEHR